MNPHNRLHDNELEITAALVQELVASQFPEYAGLSITRLGDTGSTNIQFRLGDEFLVRLPRQPGGGRSIAKELRWTPVLGERLGAGCSVSVPEFVSTGEPEAGYPERWAITRWIPGEHPVPYRAGEAGADEGKRLADDLAGVIRILRATEISAELKHEPELDNYRGRTLAEHDPVMRRNLAQCRDIDGLELDFDRVESLWCDAVDNADFNTETEAAVWYHGDLVAENLLLVDGALTGILDFGGVGVGDGANDLVVGWELLDPPARDRFRSQLAIGDREWQRARAWALAIAMMTFQYYWHTMPGRVAARLALINAVLEDAS